MKVFVLGATGYIGLSICKGLKRQGHLVYGLARSDAKANELRKAEIFAVIGDATDPTSWKGMVSEVDMVIDATSAGQDAQKVSQVILNTTIAAVRDRTPKLGYIYCSGLWVQGSSQETVSDYTPVSQGRPVKLVHWRLPMEQEVLAARNVLDVFIIRPGLVFGGAGSLTSFFIKPFLTGSEVSFAAVKDAWLPMVHVEDVASAFCAAVQKWPVVSKIDFPIVGIAGMAEQFNTIADSLAAAVNYKGDIHYTEIDSKDLLSDALFTSIKFISSRAEQLLDWRAELPSFSQNAKIYIDAFKAYN